MGAGVAVVIGFSTPGEFIAGLSTTFYYLGILFALLIPIIILVMIGSIFRDGVSKQALKNLGIFIGLAVGLFVVSVLFGVLAPVMPAGWWAWLHLPIAIIGGMLGGALALLLFCKVHKVKLYKLSDVLVIPVALGAMFVRIGNFTNSELVGRISDVPWAMRFTGYEGLRHPSQFVYILGEY